MQVAQTLLNEINGGRYLVGSPLSTEFALGDQFGVSRSTAREAVKRLVYLAPSRPAHASGNAAPICHSALWLQPAFRAINGLVGPLCGAVHAAIGQLV